MNILLSTLWGFLLSSAPDVAITKDTSVGECWAFSGSSGQLTVRFQHPISIEAVTVDHASLRNLITGQSSPKNFEIIGHYLEKEEMKKSVLGNFTYDSTGPSTQYFPIPLQVGFSFHIVKLSIFIHCF